ncbi:MAG: cell division protein ZapA [Culturomica sp.]|jgi:cell division protein ZapA|nr:cell division protein ZapA [Culturomica sp.]
MDAQIDIAGKKYPMTVNNEEQEEIYRAAAKRINDMILKYRERYGSLDPSDLLALSAFQLTVKLLSTERRNDTAPIINEIEKINVKIDEIIREQNI